MTRYQSTMLLALTAVAVLVGAALFFEHVDEQTPCPLCLMQRLWFLLAGLVAFTALTAGARPQRRYPLLLITSAVIGAAFSIRQLWLQQLPPDRVPACGPGLDYMIDVFPAMEVLQAMTLGTGDCAETSWTLLGLGMAAWALIGFVFLIALGLYGLLGPHRS